MLQVRAVFMAAWVSAAVLSGSSHPQDPPPGNGPPPSGSARLRGRVIAADDGAAVSGANVRLSGLPDSERDAVHRAYVTRDITSDDGGGFEFTQLPAGWYTVRAEIETGFVPLARSRETTLQEGATVEITIRLVRTGAISGRVQDASGAPMSDAQVQALRKNGIGDLYSASAAATTSTDGSGDFRVSNVHPGEYYILAMPNRLQATDGDELRVGHGPTFYPGAAHLRDARIVVVRPGADSGNVNVTLAARRLARVRINAMDSGGRPLASREKLTLYPAGETYFHAGWHVTRVEGAFVMDGIPAGEYVLLATSGPAIEEGAYVPLSVGEGEEEISLDVQTNTGASVSGRVVVEGAHSRATSAFWPDRVLVSAYPPSGKWGAMYARVPLYEGPLGNRFELKGLRGPMVLHASVPGAALVSIRREGGEEIGGKTLDFTGTEVIDDLVVTVTREIARVDVSVTGTSPPDDPEPVLVVLFSADRKRWFPNHLQYAPTTAWRAPESVSAVTPGEHPAQAEIRRLQLGGMVPGRYLVAAVHDPGLNRPCDARFLEKLRPFAVPVTLVPGQTVQVAVHVVPLKP